MISLATFLFIIFFMMVFGAAVFFRDPKIKANKLFFSWVILAVAWMAVVYFEDEEVLRDEEDVLFLIGGIIANKVKIFQKMSEEKSFLLKENLNLKKELSPKCVTSSHPKGFSDYCRFIVA